MSFISFSEYLTMPGHIKKSDGPDPDPDPWLVVSPELREKLKSKPYDAKKSCWVPDKATGGYWEGLIDSTDGDKVTVTILETKGVSAKMSKKSKFLQNQIKKLLFSLTKVKRLRTLFFLIWQSQKGHFYGSSCGLSKLHSWYTLSSPPLLPAIDFQF